MKIKSPRTCLSVFITLVILLSFQQIARAAAEFSSEAEMIADQIFQNECDKRLSCLIFWSEREEFPSLGIGHFIWYPEGYEGPFKESFPALLAFMESREVKLPSWFETLPGRHAPWPDRKSFTRAEKNGELEFLRDFLVETKKYQAEFIVNRFRQSIPKILEAAPAEKRGEIRQKLAMMIHSATGLYPLIDYVNFNGEGILLTERYNGQGWGLLQVLEEMKMPRNEKKAVLDFVIAAEIILKRRITNSPHERNEKKWFRGWQKRMRSYLAVQSFEEAPGERLPRQTLLETVSGDMDITQAVDIANFTDSLPPPPVPT